jgi:hypothetical protein
LTQLLFGEAPSRALVSCPPEKRAAFEALCKNQGLPYWRLGEVAQQRLSIKGVLDVPVASLAKAYHGGFVEALGF